MLSRSRIGQTTSSSELRLGCDVVQYDQYDHFYDLYNLSWRSPIWDSGSITRRIILKMPFTILIMMMAMMFLCFYIQINFSLFNLQFAIILTDALCQNYFRLFNATDVNNSFPRHLPVLAKSFFKTKSFETNRLKDSCLHHRCIVQFQVLALEVLHSSSRSLRSEIFSF